MKKSFLIIATVLSLNAVFTSCRNTSEKDNTMQVSDDADSVGKDLNNAADNTGNAIDNAANDVDDAVDNAANDVGDAVDKGANKVNDEVNGTDDN